MYRYRGISILGGILVAVSVAACGSTGPGSQSSPGRLTLSSCVVANVSTARCGKLSVAENPAKASGRQIAIGVIVLPAYGVNRASDPLFYFAGGPGVAASHDVGWAVSTFRQMNATHDLVFVDQRGTGASNEMKCPDLMQLSSDPSTGQPPSAAVIGAAAKACLASLSGPDPAMYTTPNSVDDVDQVRAALGYKSIDIYGASYGVSAGLAYIQRHGDHVRSALFDSGSLLDVRIWEKGAQYLEASLESVLDRCAANQACHAAFPAPMSELTTVISRLNQAPVHLQVTDSKTGQAQATTIDSVVLIGALADRLSTTTDQATVPLFIHKAYSGLWQELANQYVASRPADNPQTTAVMARTIECSDGWGQMNPDAIRATGGASLFTNYQVNAALMQHGFCAAWPAAVGASGSVHSTAPVVFLNGTADSADPPGNVADAAATMPNSLVVPVQGYGHGQLSQDSSGCLVTAANLFLDEGVRSTRGAWACAQSPPFPSFVLS